MKTYTVLGTTNEETICGLCGRNDLRSTVALRDNQDGSIVHFGSECASRATGWTVKEVAAEIKSAAAAAETVRAAAAAVEFKSWEQFLSETTGTSDISAAIKALGGFGPARQMYREVAA